MSMRPRTREDDARYDAISRKAIKNMRDGEWAPVDPAEFTSTVDYLKWCDRVGDGTGVWDASLPTGGVSKPNLYDAVRKLRGDPVRTARQESGRRRVVPPGTTETPPTERRNPVKRLLYTAIGVVVVTLVLTSHWFARDTHGDHRTRVIAGVVIVAVWFVAGHLASRGRKPKPPVAPQRPGYTSTRF